MIRDDTAEQSLRLVISDRPDIVEPRAALARLLMETNNRTQALAVLRDGMIFAGAREDRLEQLADAFLALDALPDALEALQAASRLCPADNRLHERIRDLSLRLKDGQTVTRQLFNQYAAEFEDHLAKLRYAAPQQIEQALAPFAARVQGGTIIDLGCGTGLMGVRLRGMASRLVGIDLSAAMLQEARAKQLYDDLIEGDAVERLASQSGASLIVAADVLVYIGDLAPLFSAVARALLPGGLFAFTVERLDGQAYALNPANRYSHSKSYITKTATQAGLKVLVCEAVTPRLDGDRPVDGLLVILEAITARPEPLQNSPSGTCQAF